MNALDETLTPENKKFLHDVDHNGRVHTINNELKEMLVGKTKNSYLGLLLDNHFKKKSSIEKE